MIAKIISSSALLIWSSLNTTAFAQTYVPPAPGQDWTTGGNAQISQDIAQASRYVYDCEGRTTLAQEQAEQSTDAVAQSIECKAFPAIYYIAPDYSGMVVHNCRDLTMKMEQPHPLDVEAQRCRLELEEIFSLLMLYLKVYLPPSQFAEFLFRPTWIQIFILEQFVGIMFIYFVLSKCKSAQRFY